jgi:hypothetical protein
MACTLLAAAIDQEAGRHCLDLELPRNLASGIELDAERRGQIAQERISEGSLAIHVDGNDDQAARAVSLLQIVHPWK